MKPDKELPWKHGRDNSSPSNEVRTVSTQVDYLGNLVCKMSTSGPGKGHADAAYIVHACNAYPRLVEALKLSGHAKPLLQELGEIE
jgi:hypothetical protein